MNQDAKAASSTAPAAPFSFALLEATLEMLPIAKIVVDHNGVVRLANALADRLFGYPRSALVGTSVDKLLPPRYRTGHAANRTAFLKEPVTRSMGAGRELHALRRDESEFPVEIGLNPIETDRGPMVLAFVVDITERKRQERRFAQVVESSPNAMVMVGSDGLITMVNAQAEHLFGYGRREMLGQRMEMLVPERFRPGHPSFRDGYFKAPGARPMGAGRDLYARRKDGAEVPVEIGLNPIETEEGTMVLSAIVDISERRQREERIRTALREKETLLSEVHHRVKNNLQVIHSLLDLQAMRVSDPHARDVLRESQNRVRSMSLIHQTLYQSQDFARVDFGHFLQALSPSLQEAFGAGRENVAIEVDGGGVALSLGAAIPCGLIVNELVTNALKHGYDEGEPGLVSIGMRSEPQGGLQLDITNDGRPLPGDFVARQQASLGMELVNLLCEQLGGRLEIRNAYPVRFSIFFPQS